MPLSSLAWRCVHIPTRRACGAASTRSTIAADVRWQCPASAEPGLDLDLDAADRDRDPPSWLRRRPAALGRVGVARGHGDALAHRIVDDRPWDRVQHADRHDQPGVTQLERLVHRRDAQTVGPGVDQRPGDRDGAMPVCIALDDGMDGGTATARPERGEIRRRVPRGPARARPDAGVAAARPRRVALRSTLRAASHAPGVAVRWRCRRRLGGLPDTEPEPLVGRMSLGDRPQATPGDGDPLRQVGGEDTGVAEPFARPRPRPGRGGRHRAARPSTATGPVPGATRSCPRGRRRSRHSRAPGSRMAPRRPRPSGDATTVRAPFRTTT